MVIVIINETVDLQVRHEEIMETIVSLDMLKKGERFRINRVTHVREIGKKLADMGFTKGVEGLVVRFALLHDPIEIRILGYNVTIRRAEAAGINVEKISAVLPAVVTQKGKR
jgi:Fe2+ transport system protein FeoA